MIIEFIYNKQKKMILMFFSPLQFINMVTLIILAELLLQNERSLILDIVRSHVYEDDSDESSIILEKSVYIVRYIHLTTTIMQALLTCIIIHGMKGIYFKRVSSWIDLLGIIINFFVHTQIITSYVSHDESNTGIDLRVYKDNTIFLRATFVVGILLMYSRVNYFLGLVDQIAPLLSIVYQIFYDITYFMVLLLWTGLSFAISFYILGRN